MKDDIFDSIPISEDDIVININYLVFFAANDSFAGFDSWMQESLLENIKGFNLGNAIRLNKIEFPSERIISFRIKQLNPDISLQEILDALEEKLFGMLKTLSINQTDYFWKDISSFTIGDEKEAMEEAANYIRKIAKNRD